MAVSGSNDFNQTEQTIIKDALILCGGLEDDEDPTSEQQTYSRRALNRMCKAWSKKGLKAWCWNEVTLTLATSQASYSIGPTGADLVTERPLELRNVRKVVTGTQEVPIRVISRSEYMEQPSKDSDSEPVSVFYDPQLDNGIMYVWPSPSGAYSLKFSAKQYIEDFDSSTNNPYFPTEWLEAIVYNLALRLCPKYEVNVNSSTYKEIKDLAVTFLMDAEDGDAEEGSYYIEPDSYY